MSDNDGVRRELFHTVCRLAQEYPALRFCQILCNAIPPEELTRRSNSLYYIEDAELLVWLRSFERWMKVEAAKLAASKPAPVVPTEPIEPNPIEWCPGCKEQVVRYPGEEVCPFCRGATVEMGDYIDHIHETYRDRR